MKAKKHCIAIRAERLNICTLRENRHWVVTSENEESRITSVFVLNRENKIVKEVLTIINKNYKPRKFYRVKEYNPNTGLLKREYVYSVDKILVREETIIDNGLAVRCREYNTDGTMSSETLITS